jgi:hypothetical protein
MFRTRTIKYRGFIILTVSPAAYRLFKNDRLVDQFGGNVKAAKLNIDNLIDR